MTHRSLLIASSLILLAACDDPSDRAPAARVEAAPTAPAEPPPPLDVRQTVDVNPAISSVGFTASKVTASHEGSFSTFTGRVRLDPESIENSTISITIQMSSLGIEPPRLREHLVSPDLFDVAQYPTATFETTRIVAAAQSGTYTVTGNLTLHGQTRAITFPASIQVSDGEVYARAEFTIDRRDFGIVYPGMPDDLIRDGVVVRFDVHAPRPNASSAAQ